MTFADHNPSAAPQHPRPEPPCSEPLKTGVILLAAGFSRRFGSIKLQAALPNGNTMLQQCFNNILHVTENIIVVARHDLHHAGVYKFLPDLPGIQLVTCEDAESGMGHSLACAIRHIPDDWQSVLVCLGDMPFIKIDTFVAIMTASSKDKIVIPVWQSKRGHPVCFGRAFFAELANSEGDSGGRHVLKQHSQAIHELNTDDQGVVQDIDTPEALALLIRQG